ncbi:Zinc transporter 6-A [Taenia solium]|eukprot:TsM_000758100 transcript=TsM_000758100 gene=TsM_000758100
MNEGKNDLIEGLSDSQGFTKGLRHEDVSNVLITQHNLLSRLEKTNAMLQTVNELSTNRLESLASQLRANTRLLVSMKRELITILRRTESVRKTLMNLYPPAYESASGAVESMGLNLVSLMSNVYSGILSDLKYCKKFAIDLLREVVCLAKDSEQASQILKLACCIFLGLIVVRVLAYLSNSIALSAFSDLILFDVLFLFVALVSIWVKRQTPDVRTYCFGYDRFEVIAVFASTILSILSSFYLLKEAIERLFEPVVEQVSDISRSMRSHVPALSRALPPRMNPIALVGSMIVVVTLITYFMVDPTTETGTFPDTVAAVVISLLLFNTMVPMAVFSGKILLQTTPSYLVTALDKALREASTLEGVLELRNEHFWTIGFGVLVGSLYVRVRRDASDQLVLAHVTKRLHPFVKHLTIQVIKDDWARPVAGSNFDWSQPTGYLQSVTLLQAPTGRVH